MSGEVFYGQRVRRSEGSRTAKGIVGRQMADSWKFLLCFSITRFLEVNNPKIIKSISCITAALISILTKFVYDLCLMYLVNMCIHPIGKRVSDYVIFHISPVAY